MPKSIWRTASTSCCALNWGCAPLGERWEGKSRQRPPPAPPSTQSPHLYTAQLLVPSLSHPGFLSSWRRISAFALEKQGLITDTDRSATWMCRSALPFAQLLPLHLWKILALVVGRVCVLIFPCSQKDVAIFLQNNKACALISKYLSLDTGDVYQFILKQKKIFQLLIYFF